MVLIMTRLTILILTATFLVFGQYSNGQTVDSTSTRQSDSTIQKPEGLITENFLYPGDVSTAFTFAKGECAVYKASINILPLDWATYGVTDWCTAHLDIWNWVFGIPSFNFRFAMAKQKGLRPAFAFETMYLYPNKAEDLLGKQAPLYLAKTGHSWYNHFNASWKQSQKLYFHFSTGATYSQHLIIANRDSINYKGKEYFDLISPDISLGIDWRPKKWVSLHFNVSYGSTFVYVDNIPNKQQIVFATRLAPFVNSSYGFFRTLRMEIAVMSMYFKDADIHLAGFNGYLYWQWDWNKNRKKKK